jgi:hypothetical protein
MTATPDSSDHEVQVRVSDMARLVAALYIVVDEIAIAARTCPRELERAATLWRERMDNEMIGGFTFAELRELGETLNATEQN